MLRLLWGVLSLSLAIHAVFFAGLSTTSIAGESVEHQRQESPQDAVVLLIENVPNEEPETDLHEAPLLLLAQAETKAEPGEAKSGEAREGVVGSVKNTKGGVSIVRDGKSSAANVGDRLHVRDILKTEKDGSIGVILKDNTVMSLGPSSELEMKEFKFEPKKEEYSFVADMVKGTFVYVSGLIGKLSPESVKMETPVGIIAVRGTKLLVRIKG